MDPEPGIRTNTTICLGKIAKHLTDAVSVLNLFESDLIRLLSFYRPEEKFWYLLSQEA